MKPPANKIKFCIIENSTVTGGYGGDGANGFYIPEGLDPPVALVHYQHAVPGGVPGDAVGELELPVADAAPSALGATAGVMAVALAANDWPQLIQNWLPGSL